MTSSSGGPADVSPDHPLPAHRLIEVPGERLAKWVARFGDRHGAPEVVVSLTDVTLTSPDGAVAVLDRPWVSAPASPDARPVTTVATPDSSPDARAGDWLGDLTTRALLGREAGVLLIRRGGYAVGVVADGTVTRHKVGTKYVQSRTAAGGWSQQRFARRRDGQAKALIGAACDALVGVLDGRVPPALVVGGDRILVADVLADPRLSPLSDLPRHELWDIADPRLRTLTEAAGRACAIRIRLNDAAAARPAR